jgi:hypothetical protein
MKISKQLNVVIDTENGAVHAMPIGQAVFEKYFEEIGATFDSLYTMIGALAAPRVAALELRKICQARGTWEGEQGVQQGLMNEIFRLANYVHLDAEKGPGWQVMPLYDAIQQGKIGDREKGEVANALVFFTCASSMHRADGLTFALHSMTQYWGGQTTSLDCTEYAASLPIPTAAASSGEKATPSSTGS